MYKKPPIVIQLVLIITIFFYSFSYSQEVKTQIFILGSDHLSQVYKTGNSYTDVLTSSNQNSIMEFNSMVAKFQPDTIMVEELSESQNQIDSLYLNYNSNSLNLNNLENGRSEIYTIAFAIGKKLKIPKIICVNSVGGTSQSILDNGDNIEIYKKYTSELRKVVSDKYNALGSGELSFKDYLISLNQPDIYNLIYRLRYVIPARVINGTFKNPEKTIDTTKIDSKYIGAEMISIFKNRDYKIYSNIISSQSKTNCKKILLVIGVAHVGSLKNIFKEDPYFEVVDASRYLK